METQPVPDAEGSALFDAEYRRRLLHWATEQVRGEFTDLAWKVFWQAGVEGRTAREVADALKSARILVIAMVILLIGTGLSVTFNAWGQQPQNNKL